MWHKEDFKESEYEFNASFMNFLSNWSEGLNSSWIENVCGAADEGGQLSAKLFEGFVFVLYCIVFFVALTGNGLVCIVVTRSPRMKTVTNYFIVNLAVGDILMTVFCVPFSFVSMLVLPYWPFGKVMCKVVNYSQAVSVLVSAYTLLAISVDRYMAIMRPLRPRLGRGVARLLVTAVWLGALATAAPIALVSQLQAPTPWHETCAKSVCAEEWWEESQRPRYTLALLVLQFTLPLAALTCTYARIAYAVWGGRPPGEAQHARDSRLHRSKKKMIKMMVTVVAVFTVCWLPLNVFIMLWTTYEGDEDYVSWPGMKYVWFACHWLAMSHSCCNPIIYCYMNKSFKRGFQQIFGVISCLGTIKYNASTHHASGAEGAPMSELVGVGIMRHGTSSSYLASRLQRAPTCSSCGSTRRYNHSHTSDKEKCHTALPVCHQAVPHSKQATHNDDQSALNHNGGTPSSMNDTTSQKKEASDRHHIQTHYESDHIPVRAISVRTHFVNNA